MTGGVVVVLGATGRNFAAGMSGGVAFVLDEDGLLARRCNHALVELSAVTAREDLRLLRRLVTRHAKLTGSRRAKALLEHWDAAAPRFVRVMPTEYRRVLEQRGGGQRQSGRHEHGRSEGVPLHPADRAAAAAGGRADHHVAGVLRAGVG
jgi:glutamate synthase domain-containing protein 3